MTAAVRQADQIDAFLAALHTDNYVGASFAFAAWRRDDVLRNLACRIVFRTRPPAPDWQFSDDVQELAIRRGWIPAERIREALISVRENRIVLVGDTLTLKSDRGDGYLWTHLLPGPKGRRITGWRAHALHGLGESQYSLLTSDGVMRIDAQLRLARRRPFNGWGNLAAFLGEGEEPFELIDRSNTYLECFAPIYARIEPESSLSSAGVLSVTVRSLSTSKAGPMRLLLGSAGAAPPRTLQVRRRRKSDVWQSLVRLTPPLAGARLTLMLGANVADEAILRVNPQSVSERKSMVARPKYSKVPAETAAPLGLLVEAAAAPELFKARHVVGTRIERAETLDALSHGAVTLPHLMTEWAMYSGRMSVRTGLSGSDEISIENSEFHEALEAISRHFPLQFSMPLPPRGKGRALAPDDWPGWTYRRMRTSGKNKLHMVERTVFEDISYGVPEDVGDAEVEAAAEHAEKSGNIPHFDEPAILLESGTPVGLVWVRIVPEIIRAYRDDPAILYSLIAETHRTRLAQLRQQIAATDPPFKAKEAEQLNAFLGSETQILDAFDGTVIRLKKASRSSSRELRRRLADVADPKQPARKRRQTPTVFISYSHADAKHVKALRQHLALPEREGKVVIWWDGRVEGGGQWEKEIASALNRASVVVLLVSRHFLSSTYCYQKELEAALLRAARGKTRVIPAIVGTCDWKSTSLKALLAVPKDGKPVTTFRDRDEAYVQIADSVLQAVARRRMGSGLRRTRIQRRGSRVRSSTTVGTRD